MPITPREIEDQLEDAALTLRRLPNPPGSGAKGYGQSWPEYVHDARQAYGYDEVRMRVVPSARDIQRMKDCIGWLAWLDPEDARIVWLRAEEDLCGSVVPIRIAPRAPRDAPPALGSTRA